MEEQKFFSVKEFAMIILDLCLKYNYEEQAIKQELVGLFKNWYKHFVSLSEEKDEQETINS